MMTAEKPEVLLDRLEATLDAHTPMGSGSWEVSVDPRDLANVLAALRSVMKPVRQHRGYKPGMDYISKEYQRIWAAGWRYGRRFGAAELRDRVREAVR
jgi:hypothetical protein